MELQNFNPKNGLYLPIGFYCVLTDELASYQDLQFTACAHRRVTKRGGIPGIIASDCMILYNNRDCPTLGCQLKIVFWIAGNGELPPKKLQ